MVLFLTGGRDRSSKSGGGKVNDDEIADDPFDSAEPKAKSGGEKGLTFGKVRQAPKGTISEEDISAADQVLKKADSDGGECLNLLSLSSKNIKMITNQFSFIKSWALITDIIKTII